MTPREAREGLAAYIGSLVAYPVLSHPVSAPPKPPVVVLAPRPTYLQQGTTCTWEMRLTVTVAVGIQTREDGMALLDDMVLEVAQAIVSYNAAPTTADQVTDLVTRAEAGGVEYMTATIQTTSYVT